MPSSLRVRRLCVSAAQRPLLADVDLDLPAVGVTWLVGPVAAGKSTLLRTLAGVFDDKPGMTVNGLVDDVGRRPRLVVQNAGTLLQPPLHAIAAALPERDALAARAARELASVALLEAGLGELMESRQAVAELPLDERRLIAIIQAAATEPSVLLLDEPTASLDEAGRARVLVVLGKLALRCSLLVATHNQGDLRALPGRVVLLAGGRIVERGSSASFLMNPASPEGAAFVRTGSCPTPSLEHQARESVRDHGAAASIKWIVPERLAGSPRPGLLRDVETDLEALAAAGATTLVCLEEAVPYDLALLRAFGVTHLHAPIRDMEAGSPGQLHELAESLRARIEGGATVVVHCRAGLGRTGMVLAAILICGGETFAGALGRVRRIEARFIQSEPQMEALQALEEFVRARRSMA